MEQDTSAQRSMTEVLAELGVPVTAEGKARASERLRDADARRDHAERAAFLAEIRRRPAPAA
ncbi:hypothetical protein [Actinoplanes aureus]|uniref:Uncharacterized protein n=1 Tax=Actinoplanes aureus TaxID=2792083 RepID=A0A931G0Z3_9ACTN|nr:hypothetical protein [Actinoplanes aureus]MBG0564586.1 hypothetical protein [Actinoplanes aureus]